MKKALGILGGMGPQATVDFLQKIINLTEAAVDSEHIRIYLDNHSQVPDRTAAILGGGLSCLPALQESIHKLEGCGAGVIAMPCVTAHYFSPGIQEVVTGQFIDILEVIVQVCRERFPDQCAGVLTSVGTAESQLMTNRLRSAEINHITLEPADQLELGRLILQVKGKQVAATIPRFQALVNEMRKRGADYFILGCTELPLIAGAYDFPYPSIDVTEELARAAILACGYALKNN